MKRALNSAVTAVAATMTIVAGAQTALEAQPIEDTQVYGRRQMHPELAEALIGQVKEEFNSAYLYLGMSLYFDRLALPGFAHWFMVHAQEEMDHAQRAMDFLQNRDVDFQLPELSPPPVAYASPLEAFEHALEHEMRLTLKINNLYALAQKLGEYDAAHYLQWFLAEQVEEEDLFHTTTARVRMLQGDSYGGLLIIDQELGKRSVE